MKPYLQLAADASKEDDSIVANLIKMGVLVEADYPSEVGVNEDSKGKQVGKWTLFSPKPGEIEGIESLLGFRSVYRASGRFAATRLPPGTYILYEQ